MNFVQIIEFSTTREADVDALLDQWMERTRGKRTATRGVQTRDRDRANTYVQIVEFPSHAAAMANSSHPATATFAEQLRTICQGDIVFRKGDVADAMYYSVSGRYRLIEMGIELPTGQVFGDLGLLAPDNLRTQTIECVEDGDVLTATYQQVKELYFQNPQFGFFFLRLTSERLFDNIKRLEQEIVRKNEVIAELGGKPA